MPATSEYQHAEAFCVMKYASDDGTEVEFVWNSRDGVTPFIIPLRSGREGRHVDWSMDRREVDFDPPSGSRVFVDTSPEMNREYATAMVERYWDGLPGFPKMSDRWATKEEAVAVLTQDSQDGSPSMIEADEYKRRVAEGTLYLISPVAPPTPVDPNGVIKFPER